MVQQIIDFQKLTSIQSQNSLEEVLENEELKNFLNQMNQELVVPESQLDPDFSQDYNDVQPKKIKYSSTKVKTRNLLTNVSYRRYNLKDENRSFYKDLFSYILLNLSPIGLDRKLDSDFERNQLKMIWDVCVLRSFTQYLFKEDNFTELSKQSLTYQKANNIVLNCIDKDKQNIELLKLAIKNNLQTIQFCYSTLYSKIYARTNAFGIQNKAKFDFVYSKWKNNKNALSFIQTLIVNELPFTQAAIKQEKNVDNYKNRIRHPTEQKPIKVIDLTNVDGEEQPETFEKRTPILPDKKFVQEKQQKHQLKLMRNN